MKGSDYNKKCLVGPIMAQVKRILSLKPPLVLPFPFSPYLHPIETPFF